MKLEQAKKIFNALKENDKLSLIEKVMPHSGTYRQLDNQGFWTDGQWINLANEFIKSVDWAKGIETEKICIHDSTHVVNGDSENGNPYEGIGFYSDNKLLYIEDLEFIGHNNENLVTKFTIEESKINKGCMMLIATDSKGNKYVVGGNPHFPHFLDKYEGCFEFDIKNLKIK